MIDLWGSATMRTGGEDLAQALCLIGARPTWDAASARVSGFEILSSSELGRPRVDVCLRISGLFRDVFPTQIAVFDAAVRAVAARDEDDDTNPLASVFRARGDLSRVFGGAPQTYGAGIAEAIARDAWETRAELGELYLRASDHAFTAQGAQPARAGFEERLRAVDALVHTQDMAETDVLAGPAFAETEGGFLAAAQALGAEPGVYHIDATRADRARIREMRVEIARVARGKFGGGRWIEGQMRHGYRGAAEIADAVANLLCFAATSNEVSNATFDLAYDATLGDERVRAFLERQNPAAADALARDFAIALRRGLWTSRRNSLILHIDRESTP